MNDATPTDVLCSPGLGLGCLACCPPIRPPGYDHADYKGSLRRLLSENRQAWLAGQLPAKPELGFWCAGLGFLDAAGRRAGCLYHPANNGGRDLRESTGYADKCRREWCPAARAWRALELEARAALLGLCAGLDSLDFGSPRKNPLMRLLALGPVVSGAAARLGLGSLERMGAWPWLASAPPAWGWLLGLLLTARGADLLERPGLGLMLERGAAELARGLGPSPPLEQGQPWAGLCDEWEARFWRESSGRRRARGEDLEKWRGLAVTVVEGM